MCNACLSDTKTKSRTTFTVEYKGRIIVIKNVPCLVCAVCGEISFQDDVSANIEKLVDAAKKRMQEILVIEYCKAE